MQYPLIARILKKWVRPIRTDKHSFAKGQCGLLANAPGRSYAERAVLRSDIVLFSGLVILGSLLADLSHHIQCAQKLALVADETSSWAAVNFCEISWQHSRIDVYRERAMDRTSLSTTEQPESEAGLQQRAEAYGRKLATTLGIKNVRIEVRYENTDYKQGDLAFARTRVIAPADYFAGGSIWKLSGGSPEETAVAVLPDDQPAALMSLVPGNDRLREVLVPCYGRCRNSMSKMSTSSRAASSAVWKIAPHTL